MNLHHTKHHQAYVNGLNAAEQSYAQAPSPKERIKLQAALKFNGGGLSCRISRSKHTFIHSPLGHINHTLFWKNLAPTSAGGGEFQAGPLKSAIEKDFGSVEGL